MTAIVPPEVLPRLPELPGLDIAARYVARNHHGVGGDWYDLLLLPEGRIGIAIGDVMGHGLVSATVMGRVRAALRTYARDGSDPVTVLSRLDSLMLRFEPGQMATAVYGVLDPETGALTMSCAGHPSPVVCAAGRRAVELDLLHDLPLGVERGMPRRATTTELPPGATLVLFTDGLVERRAGDIDADLIALRRVLDTAAAAGADRLCAEIMSELVGLGESEDDVSLLVLERSR